MAYTSLVNRRLFIGGETEPASLSRGITLTGCVACGALARSPNHSVPTDYSNLTRAELVRRLGELEAAEHGPAAVHDSAERLRAVVNTAVEAIITIDDRGIIDSFNAAAEKMFGYSAAEITGQNVSALMPSPYREQHDGYLRNYCQTGLARIIGIGREVVGRRKDGTVFPMDLSVGEVHLSSGRLFTGIARDITARKRVESALRREHLFTTTVLETSSALVVVLGRNGNIVRFNRACELVTGCPLAEVEGDNWVRRFVFPEEADAVRRVLEALRDGDVRGQYESDIRTQDGSRRRVSWSNSALLGDDGEVEFFIGVGIDVTERRRLEREILEISDREQRRIGRDLHDGLGQHLTALELLNQTLVGRLRKDAPALATPAADISRQIREIITQTRLLSHNLSPVPLEADGLMIALGELAAGTAAIAGVSCEFVCPQQVLLPDADAATHLYRIAQEAVNNALKHGRARRIRLALEERSRSWEMRVEDDGCGFRPEQQRQPGLGLRMMRHRAELIGAALDIDSSSRKGTKIICVLPKKA